MTLPESGVARPLGRDWWDVVVVGAGPAGSLAARELALAGARVALLEARSIPRHKTCGGGIVWRARKAIPVDLADVLESECSRASMHLLDSGFEYTVSRPVPIVSMTTRATFDARLAAAAEEAGTVLRTECPVSALERTPDGIVLTAGGETHRARFVIAADGAAGPTRRLAGWPRPLPRIPAIEWEARSDAPHDLDPAHGARFMFGLANHGYAWIFPKHDHLSVGVLSTRRGARGMRTALERNLAAMGVGRLSEIRRHGYVIPHLAADADLVRGRVLLSGDAAGLVDPITWEGISHACTSGIQAARALLAGELTHVDVVADHYRRELEIRVLRELRWAHRLKRVLYEAPRLRTFLFRRMGPELCEAMGDVMLGESTYRELIHDPRRQGRLLARMIGLSPSRES